MSSTFRERLRRGEPLIGTIVSVASTDVVEVLATCGFDWLFIDAEHAPLAPAVVQQLVMAAGKLPCLVRLPANDEAFIKQALDAGAAGIIVPLVNSAAEAASVVRRAKYPPQGMRGVGTSRALGFNLAHCSIDGMNVRTVYQEFIKVVDEVRLNSMPYLVETKTYRYQGHSVSDPDCVGSILFTDVLSFVFPYNGFPIIEHILGTPWQAATNNPHPGIDFDYQCRIIEEYRQQTGRVLARYHPAHEDARSDAHGGR